MDRPKISCIYCIECEINKKKYIGKTDNVHERYDAHFYDLKRGHHLNYLLQQDVLDFGLENFSYFILEYCDSDNLNDREKYWIKYYNTFKDRSKGYNLDSGGEFCYSEKENNKGMNKATRMMGTSNKRKVVNRIIVSYLNKKMEINKYDEFKNELLNYMDDYIRNSPSIQTINNFLKSLNIDYYVKSARRKIDGNSARIWMIVERGCE